MHRNSHNDTDAQLMAVAVRRNGIQLTSYLTTTIPALAAAGLQVTAAAIHDDIRPDHTPLGLITYTAPMPDTQIPLRYGRQATLLTPDGAWIVVVTLTATDEETAGEIVTITAATDLGPQPAGRNTSHDHHSSMAWSDSPTMRNER